MKIPAIILSVFLIIITSLPGISQPGRLDLSFGDHGIVVSPINENRQMGLALAVQSDGKAILAGMQEISNSSDFAVARYNEDGSPDMDFGTNGFVTIEGGSDSDAAWAIALQDDGKIVLGGSVYNQFSSVDDYAVVRLNTDGSPDNTFGPGGNGVVTTDIDGFWDNAYDIAIQDDGKILLAGDGYSNDKRNVCVVRYNTDGSLDASFGTAGIALHSVSSVKDQTRAIAIQADGKILAAGNINDGEDDQAFIIRMNADGTLDNTFHNDGLTTIAIGDNDDRFWDICMLSDGRIIAGGFTMNPSEEIDALLVRYLSDGELDNSFGVGGTGIMMYNFNTNDVIMQVALQEDGKILATGGAFSFELVRLLEDGQKDNTFGENGVVNTSIGNYCSSNALQLSGENKVILGGQSYDGTNYNFALARYFLDDNAHVQEQTEVFDQLNVYPNPVSGNQLGLNYTMQKDDKISIDLLNIYGQMIESFVEKQSRTAGLHNENILLPETLSSGIYLLRLSSSRGSAVARLEIN